MEADPIMEYGTQFLVVATTETTSPKTKAARRGRQFLTRPISSQAEEQKRGIECLRLRPVPEEQKMEVRYAWSLFRTFFRVSR
jgi:hypothetical protein